MTDLLGEGAAGALPGRGPWRSATPPSAFAPFPPHALDGSVVDRFLEVAERHGPDEALASPSGRWTYQELRETVLRRSHAVSALVADGAARPVGVLATHDGPLVGAILAVLAAGHIVVVLDPVAPEEQLLHVLAESGAPVVLHDADHAELARTLAERAGAGAPVDLAELDAAGVADDGADRSLPPRRTGPDDPVMLAFTSGTSGASKAAVITNRVLMNLVRGASDALGIGPDDRMPMLFPTSLAVAAYPMFLPLLNGGTLATLDVRSVGLAPIGPFLRDERITLAYMAPTVVRFLVGSLDGLTFPDLRMIALGGEVVDAEVVRLTQELLAPERIANGFGTTETGVITLYVLEPGEVPDGPVPAGYPVPDVELVILDEHGRPVEPGTSGEIAVSSPHVFAGYWGHHELDRTVLAPDRQGRPGWQTYRTGDLGVIDGNGALTVLGRLDTKVKVRGRFVVLGDVEAEVHQLDAVADAAVVASEREGVVELTAVVVPAAGADADGPALRAAMLDRFEAYRVPARWLLVDELPRLPNGKVDRQAVAELAEGGAAPGALPVVAPASAAPAPVASGSVRDRATLEAELADLWRRLLPVGPVGLDDDFFHLGGHSLLAAQMLVMVEEELGVTVPMSAVLEARTVRTLCDVIERIVGEGDADPSTVVCVGAGSPGRPTLWFVHDLPGSAYRVRHLAEALGSDQPVWSFESPLLRGGPNPYRSLDQLAARYVADLRQAQPEGPYWLGGYSFGGICAYEMARQLRAAGQEVAFVGVVDVGPGYRGPSWRARQSPPWPYFGVPHAPRRGAGPAEVARHYLEMLSSNPRAAVRHLTLRTGIARPVDAVRFRRDLRAAGRVRPEWRLWYVWEEHWKLAARAWDRTYRYDGRLDLFWAAATGSADSTMGWGPLVGDLRIHRFEGVHEDILEAHGVAAPARALRGVIDDLLAGA